MIWPARAWIALATLGALGCERTPVPTQVVVLVDAERAVQQVMTSLHLSVYDEAGVSKLDTTVSLPRLPLKLALAPEGGNSSRRYTVEVDALDHEQSVVAQARLASGYVANQKRFVVLLLEASCLSMRCPDPDQTCSAGACVSALQDAGEFGTSQDAAQDAANARGRELPSDRAGEQGLPATDAHGGGGGSSGSSAQLSRSGSGGIAMTGMAGTGGTAADEPNDMDGVAGAATDDDSARDAQVAQDAGRGGSADVGLADSGISGSGGVVASLDVGEAGSGGSAAGEGGGGGMLDADGGRSGADEAGTGGRGGMDSADDGASGGEPPDEPTRTGPDDVVTLPQGDWHCLQIGSVCDCLLEEGNDGNFCTQPQPTCCLTRLTSDNPNCQCWPEESVFCTVSENEAFVEACPP